MAPRTKEDSFAEEVENRLQSIFGDEDSDGLWENDDAGKDAEQEPPEPEIEPELEPEIESSDAGDAEWEEDSSEATQDPLRKLKTIVLSIEWEINAEVMTGFVEQVAVLQDHYRNDKILLVFLQLLSSLGEYIRVNLGKSHPDAFRVLNSLFNQLEKIASADHFSEAEKKKILSTELARYKKLKSQLVPVATDAVPAPASVKAKTDAAPPAEDARPIAELIADMQAGLTAEIRALRKEVRSLREALAKTRRKP